MNWFVLVVSFIGLFSALRGYNAVENFEQYPGQYISLEEQCQLLFGDTSATVCIFQQSDPCVLLYCTVQGVCKTNQSRPLDGTPCGINKWCMSGTCQTKPT